MDFTDGLNSNQSMIKNSELNANSNTSRRR